MTADIFDTDVSNIDTSYPRIVASTYDLQIAGIEKAENNAKTGDNLKVELKTTSDATSTSGEPVPAGFVIHHNISLVQTPKYDPRKPLAQFMKAAGVSGKQSDFLVSPQGIVGKTITAKVGIQKETSEYPERNTIKSFEVKA